MIQEGPRLAALGLVLERFSVSVHNKTVQQRAQTWVGVTSVTLIKIAANGTCQSAASLNCIRTVLGRHAPMHVSAVMPCHEWGIRSA